MLPGQDVETITKAPTLRMKGAAGAPINVLLVDDEEQVRMFVERVLREGGYETTTAGDGPEAIEAASKMTALDVLITDVMMPQMAGDELARRLRHNQPALKVLYLTGFSDRLFSDKVVLWEDESFLEKPCSVKGLLEAVSLLVFGRLDVPAERTS